jgi:hypothetical protein
MNCVAFGQQRIRNPKRAYQKLKCGRGTAALKRPQGVYSLRLTTFGSFVYRAAAMASRTKRVFVDARFQRVEHLAPECGRYATPGFADQQSFLES